MPENPLQAQRRAICKIVKVFYSVLEEDDDILNGAYNEVEYTFFFVYPIINQALYNVPFTFKLGESHLQCAIKQTNEDEAADAGPKIDIIMTHKRNELAVSVAEVSNPNHKVNKNRYIGDGNKIAKNLKSIIGSIEKANTIPDIQVLKKVKAHGLQVYLNKTYVYSLTKITSSYYLFVLDAVMDVPCSSGLLYQQLPGFLSSFSYIANVYMESIASINKLLDGSSWHGIPFYSNSEASTPNTSPKKSKQTRSSH